MEDARKIRAFIALKPPQEWLAQMREIQASLKHKLEDAEIRWVPPENVHLTLRFFGNILAERASDVMSAMSEVAESVEPFTLSATNLGCFPSERRPRVLWMGVADDRKLAAQLQRLLNDATRGIGEQPEERDFTPHLTLARIKSIPSREGRILVRVLEERRTFGSNWEVRMVLLIQSHLASSGPRYEILQSTALRASR